MKVKSVSGKSDRSEKIKQGSLTACYEEILGNSNKDNYVYMITSLFHKFVQLKNNEKMARMPTSVYHVLVFSLQYGWK